MSSHEPLVTHTEIAQTISHNHVIVTGAGFTRAFVPSVPLLVDDFSNDALENKVRGLSFASRLLDCERSLHPSGYINIERLMTRLDALRLRRERGQRSKRVRLSPFRTEESVSQPAP